MPRKQKLQFHGISESLSRNSRIWDELPTCCLSQINRVRLSIIQFHPLPRSTVISVFSRTMILAYQGVPYLNDQKMKRMQLYHGFKCSTGLFLHELWSGDNWGKLFGTISLVIRQGHPLKLRVKKQKSRRTHPIWLEIIPEKIAIKHHNIHKTKPLHYSCS